MTLEEQITSLELSKRLKELGVKQINWFYWVHEFGNWWLFNKENYEGKKKSSVRIWSYPAFTVAELGELLPDIQFRTDKEGSIYRIVFFGDSRGIKIEARDETNARAKLLIYLLANKLINL